MERKATNMKTDELIEELHEMNILGDIQIDACKRHLAYVEENIASIDFSFSNDADDVIINAFDTRRPDEIVATLDPFIGEVTVLSSSVLGNYEILVFHDISRSWFDELLVSY